MTEFYDLVRVATATTGAGTITLGAAPAGFFTFAQAGVPDGAAVSYGIADGANSEIGVGIYSSSGGTLTRTVTVSTNSNAPISLSGGAQVYITLAAEDLRYSNLRDVYPATPSAGQVPMWDGVGLLWTPTSIASRLGGLTLASAQTLSNAVDATVSLTGSLTFATVSGGVVTFTEAGNYLAMASLDSTVTQYATGTWATIVRLLGPPSLSALATTSDVQTQNATTQVSNLGVTAGFTAVVSDQLAVHANIGNNSNGNLSAIQVTGCRLTLIKLA